jgi:hypothetical protein
MKPEQTPVRSGAFVGLACVLGAWSALGFTAAGFMHKWRAMAVLMVLTAACLSYVVSSRKPPK